MKVVKRFKNFIIVNRGDRKKCCTKCSGKGYIVIFSDDPYSHACDDRKLKCEECNGKGVIYGGIDV